MDIDSVKVISLNWRLQMPCSWGYMDWMVKNLLMLWEEFSMTVVEDVSHIKSVSSEWFPVLCVSQFIWTSKLICDRQRYKGRICDRQRYKGTIRTRHLFESVPLMSTVKTVVSCYTGCSFCVLKMPPRNKWKPEK